MCGSIWNYTVHLQKNVKIIDQKVTELTLIGYGLRPEKFRDA